MRKTITLQLPDELFEFIHQQNGTLDPSALINKLYRDDMKRQNSDDLSLPVSDKQLIQESEQIIDEVIPSAG